MGIMAISLGGVELNVAELAILLALGIPIVSILSGTVIALAKMLRGERGGADGPSEEETRLIQQMHHQLERMEERIEALETILIETEREEAHR
jgi:phage shock protein B